jgi:GNAT superfamily N-acetyltransferase
MPIDEEEVARTVETHEAAAWSACLEAASLGENRLGADLLRRGTWSASVLAALNFGAFNRVIALGIDEPATLEDLGAIREFYRSHAQSRFVIEVTPFSQRDALLGNGLKPMTARIAKCWRKLDDLPPRTQGVTLRLLDDADRDDVASVNRSAWGLPSMLSPWFSATVGRPGFCHFGVLEGDLLVSTGALYISDDIAWIGFAATRPEYRGRGYQVATTIARLHEAAARGCRLVHTETAAEEANVSLRNIARVGFTTIYEKELLASSEV